MSAERLSKLQKFILTACYKKTVLGESLPRKLDCFKDGRSYTRLYNDALFESDIMLNYYQKYNWIGENYGYYGGSNKEKTALRRSLKILFNRGYINDYTQWSLHHGEKTGTQSFYGRTFELYELSYQSRAIITLTLKGETTAKKLLNVV